MGNRRKLRIGRKRTNANRQRRHEIPGMGIANKVANLLGEDKRAQAYETFAGPDEMFASKDLPPDEAALIEGLKAPASDTPVIKVVEARVDGVRVGTAFIHEDGQVSIKFDDDAPEEQMKHIKSTADNFGYSLEGGDFNGAP